MTFLDANTVVHYIKGNPGVVSNVQHHAPGELAISSIVLCELECGTLQNKASRRRRILSSVLKDLVIVPFDEGDALESARIYVELQTKGLLIGPKDLLIAGTARHRGGMLVTNNANEFDRVKGLKTADWRSK